MGSRVVHPDKTSHFPPSVITWACHMMQSISHAKDEALWRLDRMSATPKGPSMFVTPDFMEFHERFQQSLLDTFKPTIMLLNTSDMRYATVGADTIPRTSLKSGECRAFYQRLFDFSKTPKQSLPDLLSEALEGRSLHQSTCLLAFTRVPNGFHDWFQNQLIKMRASGQSVHIVVVILAPPLPCGWKQASVLSGSAFDAQKFNTVKLQNSYFAPNALTVITAGPSPRKVLKKIRAVSLAHTRHNFATSMLIGGVQVYNRLSRRTACFLISSATRGWQCRRVYKY